MGHSIIPWRSKEQDIDFQNVLPKLIINIFLL